MRKNKILSTVLIIILALSTALLLVGCEDKVLDSYGNEVSVESLSLNIDNYTLNVGETLVLTPSISPSSVLVSQVKWTSSDTTVAKVTKGVVSAKKGGSATITATIGGKSASCTILVEDEMAVTFYLDGEFYAKRYINPVTSKIDFPATPKDVLTDNSIPYYFDGWFESTEYAKEVNQSSIFGSSTAVYGKTTTIFSYELLSNKAIITGLTPRASSIQDLVIPTTVDGYTVSAVGYNAFENSQLSSVHFDNGLTEIYDEAFQNSKGLDQVTFAKNSTVKVIGDGVFRGCEALSNIILPTGIEEVGELVFYGCKEVSYGELYSLNTKRNDYYSPKYTYEFMGEDTMPIGGYIEPSVGYLSVTLEQSIKDFIDSGCNLMIGIGQARYGTTYAHYLEMFEYLEKYGGMMLYKDESFNNYSGSAVSTNLKKYIEDWSVNYPSFAGVHVDDEPGFSSWEEGKGEYSRYNPDGTFYPALMHNGHKVWNEHLNKKLYFVNLLPTYSPMAAFAFGADNYVYEQNLTDLKSYLVNANYDYYYKSYIDNMHPEVFSYDYYPLWEGSYPNLKNTHFEQLYLARYYAEDYNKQVYGSYIPFWNFVQINGWANGSREATYSELAWQINTAFAYGSKGYQYYCYNDYGDISGHGGSSGLWDTPVNIDGTINPTPYYNMQSVNRQSQAMAKWLLNANVDHISIHGENPNNEVTPYQMLAKRNPSLDWALVSSSGVPNIVSHMTYVANNNEYMEGVEADSREMYFVCSNNIEPVKGDGEIVLHFDRAVSGSYIYGGVEQRFFGTSLTVRVNAGEGFAVLLDK